jgi:hypothetical protein
MRAHRRARVAARAGTRHLLHFWQKRRQTPSANSTRSLRRCIVQTR